MKFIEVTVFTTTEGSELVSDVLWNYSEGGVAVLDSKDVTDLIKRPDVYWDYIDDALLEEKTDVLCKGYVNKADFEKIIKLINADILSLKENSTFNLGSLEIVNREVDGDDWRKTWKEHFKPIKIGKIVICPEWIKYDAKEDEKVVLIDSNMAFGTGEHETTSMCIKLLQEYLKPTDVVLDIGCGSGILGISSAMLGAKEVIMTDIDECAVKTAKRNAVLNGVNAKISQENLSENTSVKGDLILANIMADVLIGFSKDVKKNLKIDGIIILSGIIKEKLNDVINAYLKNNFETIKVCNEGEWCAVSMRYKG